MIHVVTQQNRMRYLRQLDEMFQLRRVHFVEERGWSGLNVRNGAEIDDWDDARTIYFMALDEEGHIGVCMRARPTDDKCIVADLFPGLVHPKSGPVSGPDIWEISRIFATPRFRRRVGLRRRDEVFLASMEAAAAAGATRLVGIIDTFHLPQAMRFPWALKALGLPLPYPEGEMIGVGIVVSNDEVHRVREAMSQDGPIIAPAHTPVPGPGMDDAVLQAVGGAMLERALPQERLRWLNEIVRKVVDAQDTASPEQIIALIEREQALHVRGARVN